MCGLGEQSASWPRTRAEPAVSPRYLEAEQADAPGLGLADHRRTIEHDDLAGLEGGRPETSFAHRFKGPKPEAGNIEAKILAREANDDTTISQCVREGDGLLVQVIKDPIGDKGARLSAGITLPGRLLVMTPGQDGVAVSRRIEDEQQREGLIAQGRELLAQEAQSLPSGAGIIFRTAAQGASLDELALDVRTLGENWRCIQDRAKSARAPATLYRDLGPIERAMRDVVRGDVERVLIDDAGACPFRGRAPAAVRHRSAPRTAPTPCRRNAAAAAS